MADMVAVPPHTHSHFNVIPPGIGLLAGIADGVIAQKKSGVLGVYRGALLVAGIGMEAANLDPNITVSTQIVGMYGLAATLGAAAAAAF